LVDYNDYVDLLNLLKIHVDMIKSMQYNYINLTSI